jgi:hypothetical protein
MGQRKCRGVRDAGKCSAAHRRRGMPAYTVHYIATKRTAPTRTSEVGPGEEPGHTYISCVCACTLCMEVLWGRQFLVPSR